MWKEYGGEKTKRETKRMKALSVGRPREAAKSEVGEAIGEQRGHGRDKVGENGDVLSERGPHITGTLTMYPFGPQIGSTFYQQGFQLLWRDLKNRFRQKQDY